MTTVGRVRAFIGVATLGGAVSVGVAVPAGMDGSTAEAAEAEVMELRVVAVQAMADRVMADRVLRVTRVRSMPRRGTVAVMAAEVMAAGPAAAVGAGTNRDKA
jgi:hypothetical protein